MKAIIEIDMNNAAFEEELELIDCVQDLVDWMYHAPSWYIGQRRVIRDINGNTVGHFTIKED